MNALKGGGAARSRRRGHGPLECRGKGQSPFLLLLGLPAAGQAASAASFLVSLRSVQAEGKAVSLDRLSGDFVRFGYGLSVLEARYACFAPIGQNCALPVTVAFMHLVVPAQKYFRGWKGKIPPRSAPRLKAEAVKALSFVGGACVVSIFGGKFDRARC